MAVHSFTDHCVLGSVAAVAFAFALTHAEGAGMGPECTSYLSKKGLANADTLAAALNNNQGFRMPCVESGDQHLYAPDPKPKIPGANDTIPLACRFGNPSMFTGNGPAGTTCCGHKPHFNWIVATCEGSTGQFCAALPSCVAGGSPKINYVAAYQYDGKSFQLMDDSSVGDLSGDGIAGNHGKGTGWESKKEAFTWQSGDWPKKYAPWAHGDGPSGPRGVTPPAGLWVLSAENFYYGAFYMLSQLGLNLAGKGAPSGTVCWDWELDPLEGTGGWAPGKPLPGDLNMLYTTNTAQSSGCMPVAWLASQANGFEHELKVPEDYQAYCKAKPDADGCQPWEKDRDVSWSGGAQSSTRFENLWDEPYVFAVVVDAKGYWTYRWRSGALANLTGWPGIERFKASRTLQPRPNPVKNEAGLRTDVRGDVTEAVIWQPSMPSEAACLRASIEAVNWDFGSGALGSIAAQLGQGGPGGSYEGAQNWWDHFADTGQNADYPLSIAGVPPSKLPNNYPCSARDHFSCTCTMAQFNNVSRAGAATSEIFF